MAMTPTVTEVEFNSIENLLDFIKPLIVEGYSIAVRTIYEEFPYQYKIKNFVVYLVDKDKDMKITLKDPEDKKNKMNPMIFNEVCLAYAMGKKVECKSENHDWEELPPIEEHGVLRQLDGVEFRVKE